MRLLKVYPESGMQAPITAPSAIWEAFVPGTEPDIDVGQNRTVLGQAGFYLNKAQPAATFGASEVPYDPAADQRSIQHGDVDSDDAGDPNVPQPANDNVIQPAAPTTSFGYNPPPQEDAPLTGTGGLY